jgi:catechol 2,3-dioxygenase-like lactoylglutathione lyase family enzyme
MILGARHVGFVVSNLEKSTNFYEGLGFQSEGTANTEMGHAISTLVGVENVTIRTLKLHLLTSEKSIWREGGFRIELIEYVNPSSNLFNFDRNNIVGRGHICFTVDDISEVVKKVLSFGGSAPFQPVFGDSGVPQAIYVLDPDGIPLELSRQSK